MNVADLTETKDDDLGHKILAIYSRKAPEYAVYRTGERVLVQYADAKALADEQRQRMTPLNPLRGEINGLIDGWRLKPAGSDLKRKAERYERRVADALALAFENDAAGAEAVLTGVKKDLFDERVATARFWYLSAAGLIALVMVLVSSVVPVESGAAQDLWHAAGAGGMGAFFSITLALHGRTVLPDLQWKSNALDAALRVVIGVIGGAVLMGFIRSGAVTINIGAAGLVKTMPPWVYVLLVGFLAGFSERMVQDLLAKAAVQSIPLPVAKPAKPVVKPDGNGAGGGGAGGGGAGGPNDNPGGPGGPTGDPGGSGPAEEDQADHCACDIDLEDQAVTADDALPAASGGVAPAT